MISQCYFENHCWLCFQNYSENQVISFPEAGARPLLRFHKLSIWNLIKTGTNCHPNISSHKRRWVIYSITHHGNCVPGHLDFFYQDSVKLLFPCSMASLEAFKVTNIECGATTWHNMNRKYQVCQMNTDKNKIIHSSYILGGTQMSKKMTMRCHQTFTAKWIHVL